MRDAKEVKEELCNCKYRIPHCMTYLNGKTWNVDETNGVVKYSLNSYKSCARACNYALSSPGRLFYIEVHITYNYI